MKVAVFKLFQVSPSDTPPCREVGVGTLWPSLVNESALKDAPTLACKEAGVAGRALVGTL